MTAIFLDWPLRAGASTSSETAGKTWDAWKTWNVFTLTCLKFFFKKHGVLLLKQELLAQAGHALEHVFAKNPDGRKKQCQPVALRSRHGGAALLL